MPFSCNIPEFYCYMRSEYAYDMKDHHGEHMRVLVFSADSIQGRAVGFDCLTSFGAMFARLPVSAFCHSTDSPDISYDQLQLWDCFSYDVEAIEYDALRHLKCDVVLKDGSVHGGEYMFTFNWKGSQLAENPGDGGFKRGHFISLGNGCYSIQPNNRIRWYEPSFITEQFPEKPDFLTNSHVWQCEGRTKWVTEDSDRFFYDIIK